ncbi:MAG: hypothetical protein KDE27_21720 [Planctomycetes bacterium]|nr:hypothetical protein [Planctomycetota bacterium]
MMRVSELAALRLWESDPGRSPLARARAFLTEVATPEIATSAAPAAVDRLAVGTRNFRVLRAYAETFGPRVPCEVACPACDSRLELEIDVRELIAAYREPPESVTVRHDGRDYSARVPTDADLGAAIEQHAGAEGLFARCALAPAPEEWPAAAIAAIESAMAAADPLAQIDLALRCPDCAHGWPAPFDALAVLYDRLAAQAQGLLLDVHRLARAYGWREADILAMAPARREHYLALLGA